MSIENRIKYLAASHVFNCIDDQAPEYLQVFERVNESHHYNTRHSVNALILPKVGSYGIKSFHANPGTHCQMRSRLRSVREVYLYNQRLWFSKSLFKVRCKKTFHVSPL